MKDKQPPLSFLNHTIDQETAVFRTTQWRKLYKDTIKCPEEQILRAYFIPIDDIMALAQFYTEHSVAISGVRGYLGHDPLKPVDPGVYQMDMMLVPVDKNGQDILSAPSALGLADGTSTIYDFTSPCPPSCDTTSVLYSATNVPEEAK